MASRNENESAYISLNTSTVCPICFENFKSPRYLPCLHTFCSDCLLSYIATACKQKEAPVGFQCPLCKTFVPAPIFPALPEKWVELIPVNKTIQALVIRGADMKFCDACKRGNEEEIASDWCKTCMETLCEICARCHKKNLASSQHRVIPIMSLNKNHHVGDKAENLEYCSIHHEKIKYFCDDHKESCCMHCVCTEHRTCTQVETVEKEAKDLLESQKINKLIKKIQKYTEALEKINTDGINNLEEIDKTSDDLIKKATVLKTELMTHIDILFEKHMNDISQVSKKSRKVLTDSTEAFSDRKLLADSFVQTLKSIKEGGSSVACVVEYYRIKQHISKIAESEVSRIEFSMKQDFQQTLQDVLKLSTFANLALNEHPQKFQFPMNSVDQFSLNVICELANSDGAITGGCFLPRGDILLVDTMTKTLAYYDNFGRFVKHISLWFFPDDLTFEDPKSDFFFISCSFGTHNRGIYNVQLVTDSTKVLKKGHFKGLKTRKYVGVTCKNGFIFVACDRAILKMDTDGNVISNFKTEEDTCSVAVSRNNHIISSSCSSHSVTSINELGEILFRYTHPELNYPYGLDVDYEDYIYVAGRNSDNIHILSPSGDLLQIIKSPNPNSIKFKKDSRVCFIGSYRTCNTKICQFTVSGS